MPKFNKKQVILITLTLALGLGLVGCGKKLEELGNTNANQGLNQNVNQNQNANTNLNTNQNQNINTTETADIIYNIPELGLKLIFPEIDCNSFVGGYNLPLSELQGYCRRYYNGNLIKKENLVFEVERSNDNFFQGNDYQYLTMLFPHDNKELIKKSVDLYDNFIKAEKNQFKITIFLSDKIGRKEIARWYITKNTENITEKELEYWNVCEAGCHIHSKKIFEDYIIWQININPSTGAGDMCLSVIKPNEKFQGDEQIKCEIIAITNQSIQSIWKKAKFIKE